MPKLIEDAEDIILKSAKEELLEKGYNDFNIRNIALKCGVGVGTIYNYFESKGELILTIILEDFSTTLNLMNNDVDVSVDLYDGLRNIFNELVDFLLVYEDIWDSRLYNEEAANSITNKKQKVQLIISDLENIIRNLLGKYSVSLTPFEVSFIAESFLYYAVKRDFSFDKLELVIRKITDK